MPEMERMKESEDLYYEVSLLDFVIVLAKRKWLVLGLTAAFALVAAIIVHVMTPLYQADTRMLIPKSGNVGRTAGALSDLGDELPVFLNIGGPADMYVNMLESRTVLDRTVQRFKLTDSYGTGTAEGARELLSERMQVDADPKSGIITLEVLDEDPVAAADISNALVDELKKLSLELNITEASQRRVFYEDQLIKANESLIAAEEEMAGFQQKTGTLRLDEQTRSVIEAIAGLSARIAEKEVELSVMRSYSTPHNPDFQIAEETLSGLRAELRKLRASDAGKGDDMLMPLGKAPEVGTEYIRKMRKLKFNETLYKLLLGQYEASRLDEANNAVMIQVIDRAVPPGNPVLPRKALIVAISTAAGFIFSVFAAFTGEYLEKVTKDPDNKPKLTALKGYISPGRKR
jgi:uncharacterized protein involved in exopolysaccharide biosynthesis